MPHDHRLETRTLILRAGGTRLLHVGAGSRWTLLRGSVRLAEPPRWLAERMVSHALRLDAGHRHTIAEPGWVTLEALTDTTLICAAPVTLASRLRAAWRMIRSRRATRLAA